MTIYEKAKAMAADYDRSHRQEELAKKYNMPIDKVRKVTMAMGYYHGKLVTEDNLFKGQVSKPVLVKDDIEKQLPFLKDYPDDLFKR